MEEENANLFGEPITIERKHPVKGYAAQPGSGPEGETCRSCTHCVQKGWYEKNFYKCELMRAVWTNSYGTDIRLRSPACRFWEEKMKKHHFNIIVDAVDDPESMRTIIEDLCSGEFGAAAVDVALVETFDPEKEER